jgi:GrpB-like predicted nucleotidyltransferase (UPF0157 family)
MAIEITDYDERWPSRAAAAAAELDAALPGLFTRIEHIGSTSVPGLAAKPVIDLMAGIADVGQAAAYEEELRRLGYQLLDVGMPGRLFYYRDEAGRRAYHLHVVPADTLATRSELLLRDHLRACPDDALRYAQLKRELAASAPGTDSYTRGKTGLIQELTDRARADRGLPPVPAREG